MARFFVLALCLMLAFPAGEALAQRRPEPAPPADQKAPDPKAGDPKAAAPAPAPLTLDALFERLAKARNPNEGRSLATQIERRWLRSGSDTADLLMTRVVQLIAAKDNERALDMLDYIVLLKPDWAEAYNKRATVHFTLDDYDGALRDLKATLAREPRHFGALTGLGMIFQRLDRPKAAYAAYAKALEIHPQIERLKQTVERLKMDVEDQTL